MCLIVCDLENSETGVLSPSWAVASQEEEEEEEESKKEKTECITWEKENDLSKWKD